MVDRRRRRDLEKEIKYTFLLDCIVLAWVAGLVSVLADKIDKVGDRNMLVLGLLFAGLTEFLMFSLEKYKLGISGLWEINVIIVLSSVMSWGILGMINLILFRSLQLLVLHTIITILCMLVLFAENAIVSFYFKNTKRFRKPKLLIIDSDDRNFNRMKRIKYGVTQVYDSWYEQIDASSDSDMEKFVEEKFPGFDSICILDGLTDRAYNIAVKKAMALNKEIFVVPKIIDVGKCGAQLVRFDDILTLHMPEHSLSLVETFVKRVMDLLVSGIGLLICAIPMGVIALCIKISSPGPVLYKQVRLTKDKREFEIYKFRTMIPDAEKYSGPVFAQKDDPRVTKIGKILRFCRLDELPQLLNIFKGDMSLVGPRPERPVFVSQFEKEIENYDYRFRVKAGLTAFSHVYGRYSTYIHDRTWYDLYYIANYSIFLDFKIILLTAKTLFLKSAAEGEDEFKIKTSPTESREVTTNEKK